MNAFVRRYAYGVILAFIFTFAVGLAFNYAQARRISDQIEQRLRESLFAVAQVEIEYLRLRHVLDEYAHGHRGVGHDELMLRFDIFWSRVPLLLEGESAQPIAGVRDLAPTVDRVMATLRAVEPRVKALKTGELAQAHSITEELEALRTPINRLLIDAYSWYGQEGSYGQEATRTVDLREKASLLGILILGGILILLLFHEIRSRKVLEGELRHLAGTDPLTGTLNRRAFISRTEEELRRASRHHRPLSIMLIDIDRFKMVNDTYGHGVGDTVLQAFVQCCTRLLRTTDLLGRYGGEEFAIALPEDDLNGAIHAAERLRQAVAGQRIPLTTGTISITASVGVTKIAAGESLADALQRADRALYAAKRAGRNRVEALDAESGQ